MINMNRIVFFGLAVTILVGLSSCLTPEKVPPPEVITKEEANSYISMRSVTKGYLTGDGKEGISQGGTVINSQADWDELTTKMNAVNDAIEPPSVDFSQTTLLAYFDEIRGSGGYSVYVTEIRTDGSEIKVHVKEVSPTEDAIEIMTQPFEIVSIEKTDLPVTFIAQ